MDLFALIEHERQQVADILDGLAPDQWTQPTLCGAWTVQEVAGHLTAGWNVGLGTFALGILKARGSFNRANEAFGRQLGARDPEAIVADLRNNAAHRFTPPGAGAEAPLTDVLVHAQDMFIPLGIDYAPDPASVVPVMDLSAARKSRRIRGTDVDDRFAMTATDSDWRLDNPGKPTLEGPTLALLLTLFGRTAAHDRLEGPTDSI